VIANLRHSGRITLPEGPRLGMKMGAPTVESRVPSSQTIHTEFTPITRTPVGSRAFLHISGAAHLVVNSGGHNVTDQAARSVGRYKTHWGMICSSNGAGKGAECHLDGVRRKQVGTRQSNT
jgi:hypothetical protein